MKEKSYVQTTIDGIIDGVMIGIDPIGAIYTSKTNKKTLGGIGWAGENYSGEKHKDVDYESDLYSGYKLFGAGTMFIFQFTSSGFPQLCSLVGDYFIHRSEKKKAKQQ